MTTLNNSYYLTDYYDGQDIIIPEGLYRYELTITFNPKYYPLGKACDYIRVVIKEIIKASCRYISAENKKLFKDGRTKEEFLTKHYLEYCVEYHKGTGQNLHYPHIHLTLHTEVDIDATKLFGLENTLRKKFGRTTLYHTGTEDRFHENDHFKGLWSQYLLKEVQENEVNGKRHYFKIDISAVN